MHQSIEKIEYLSKDNKIYITNKNKNRPSLKINPLKRGLFHNNEMKKKYINKKNKLNNIKTNPMKPTIIDVSNVELEDNILDNLLNIHITNKIKENEQDHDLSFISQLINPNEIECKDNINESENISMSATNEISETHLNESKEEKQWEDVHKIEFFPIENLTEWIIKIEVGQSIHFKGCLQFKVIHGCIEMLGKRFTPETSKTVIYSNSGSSILSLEAISSSPFRSIDQMETMLSKIGIRSEKLINRLYKNNPENYTFAHLIKYSDHLAEFVQEHSNKPLFSSIEMKKSDKDRKYYLIEKGLNCLFEPDNSQIFKTYKKHPMWDSIAENFIQIVKRGEPFRGMFCGGKGVGKSTLLRFLINRFLSEFDEVIYIDLDPGQPEFSLPGTLSLTRVKHSLHGPNFTHLTHPEFCIFIGEIDVTQCLNNYMGACKKLAEFYFNGLFDSKPCLINTMGFNKGLGPKILANIIDLVKPTHLTEILSQFPKKNFSKPLDLKWIRSFQQHSSSYISYKYQSITSVPEKKENTLSAWGLPPKDFRQLVIMAYMSRYCKPFSSTFSIWDAEPLCCPLKYLTLCVANESPEYSDYLQVFNANIVALSHIDLEIESHYRPEDPKWFTIVDRVPLSQCYGFGIVRNIDMENACIFVLIPKNSQVSNINCLVMSCAALPMPLSLLTKFDCNYSGSIPYVAQRNSPKVQVLSRPIRSKPTNASYSKKKSIQK